MNKINFKNIALNHSKSDIYGNVDGISLQNIFYAVNGYFPSCYLFSSNNRTRSTWVF